MVPDQRTDQRTNKDCPSGTKACCPKRNSLGRNLLKRFQGLKTKMLLPNICHNDCVIWYGGRTLFCHLYPYSKYRVSIGLFVVKTNIIISIAGERTNSRCKNNCYKCSYICKLHTYITTLLLIKNKFDLKQKLP